MREVEMKKFYDAESFCHDERDRSKERVVAVLSCDQDWAELHVSYVGGGARL
jgi:hypothetical protein